jgi:hypothetical protein
MNTQDTEISLSIWSKTQQQNKEFLNKINPRNLKEAKNIISKYDWNHPLSKITEEYKLDIRELNEFVKTYLEKRGEFLSLFSQYL